MERVMEAIQRLQNDQLELLNRWEKKYLAMAQENNLLQQQVDFLENKISYLEDIRLNTKKR